MNQSNRTADGSEPADPCSLTTVAWRFNETKFGGSDWRYDESPNQHRLCEELVRRVDAERLIAGLTRERDSARAAMVPSDPTYEQLSALIRVVNERLGSLRQAGPMDYALAAWRASRAAAAPQGDDK